MVSALCFFNIISHLLVVDPTSSLLEDTRQRCLKVFAFDPFFRGNHIMYTACCLLIHWRKHSYNWLDNYKPPTNEHIMIAHGLVNFARLKRQRTQQTKVPRLTLRFALLSLSLYPLPPTSVIADCLSIIAIDLGCDVSDTGTTTSDERWVCIWQMNNPLTPK